MVKALLRESRPNRSSRSTLFTVGPPKLGGLAVSRTMSSVLYGVQLNDPVTFASVSALVGIVAFLASYIPARRAAKVDPMVALRYE